MKSTVNNYLFVSIELFVIVIIFDVTYGAVVLASIIGFIDPSPGLYKIGTYNSIRPVVQRNVPTVKVTVKTELVFPTMTLLEERVIPPIVPCLKLSCIVCYPKTVPVQPFRYPTI